MASISVISASIDALSAGHTGLLGNKPEERKRLVLAALRKAPNTAVSFRMVDQPESNLHLAQCVHDKGMLDFFESAWVEWTKAVKQYHSPILISAFGECGNTPIEEFKDGVPPFVCKFGSASRHDGAQDATNASVLSKIAFYSVHTFTPIHESTVPSLKWDLAVTRAAVDAITSGVSRIAYAQVIHPGHHAGPSSFGGFCFLNHAAIAARLLQRKYKRIAIIDVDYHHGNGTMAAFWDDPSVFFASIHGDPNCEYPFTSGFAHQIGGPLAMNSTLNLPLPGGTKWPAYRASLSRVIEAVKNFQAEALVISLGLDTLQDDPVTFPQSRFALQLADYSEMGRMLLGDVESKDSLLLPTLVVQEGGYLLELVPQAVLNFLLRSNT